MPSENDDEANRDRREGDFHTNDPPPVRLRRSHGPHYGGSHLESISMKRLAIIAALIASVAFASTGITTEAAKCIKGPGGGNAVAPAPLPGPITDLLWC